MSTLSVEFHCHTIYSPDSLTTPARLVAAARGKGLDRVVVTDHNCISGALRCQALAPELIIVGEEIMTSQGELLAAFVQEEIPAGLSPRETIRRLRQQDAFISVSHPFDTMRKGHWEPAALLDILPLIDAIETFNARSMLPGANAQALAFAGQHQLAGTVGSDAHAAFELGACRLILPAFQDAAGLKAVIRQAQAQQKASPAWVHFSSRWAVLRKRLKILPINLDP